MSSGLRRRNPRAGDLIGTGGAVRDDGSNKRTKDRRGSFDETDLEATKRKRTNAGGMQAVDDGIRVGPTPSTAASSSYSYSYHDYDKRGTSGFAGLANQGATCYMNSLLQGLFMTPEFRRAMYNWKHNPETDDEPQDCIPWQLQRLFGMLQLTGRRAIATTELTKSFGWTGADAFTQNDVQEMCRVLFDAIERSLAGTGKANMINKLFTGTLNDVVKCNKCGNKRVRSDTFMDLSLVIKPFGATQCMKSVQGALDLFVKPELLSDSNQVECPVCDEKTDAVKGLELAEVPQLLMLQLKRFDFDYERLCRVKLNDYVSFPLYLDLNHYLGVEPPPLPETEAVEAAAAPAVEPLPEGTEKEATAGAEAEGPSGDEETGGGQPAAGAGAGAADDDGAAEPAFEEPDVEHLVATRGPNIYELYAVLVHSGGAQGGHYYAYIKDLGNKEWFNFNDSSVTPISLDTVMSAFGGSSVSSYTGATYTSSANAYMLLYRKYSPVEDPMRQLPQEGEVPHFVKDLVAAEAEEQRKKEEAAKLAAETLHLRVYYNRHKQTLSTHQSTTVREATEQAWLLHGLNEPADDQGAGETTAEGVPAGGDVEKPDDAKKPAGGDAEKVEVPAADGGSQPQDGGADAEATAPAGGRPPRVPLSCVRLRKYVSHTNKPMESLDEFLDVPLETLDLLTHQELALETKTSEDEPWPAYDPNLLSIRVHKYDWDSDEFLPERRVSISRNATLGDFRVAVEGVFGVPVNQQRLLRMLHHAGTCTVREYFNDSSSLKLFNYHDDMLIYLEEVPKPPEEDPFAEDDRMSPDVFESVGIKSALATKSSAPAPAPTPAPAPAAGPSPFSSLSTMSRFPPMTGTVRSPPTVRPPAVAAAVAAPAPADPTPSESAATPTPASAAPPTAPATRSTRPARTVVREPISAKNSQAVARFEKEAFTITLKFNLIGETEALQSIQVDSRLHVRDVLAKLAPVVGKEAGMFTVRRDSSYGGMLKDPDETIKRVYLRDQQKLHISGDVPLRSDEFNVKIMFHKTEEVLGSGPKSVVRGWLPEPPSPPPSPKPTPAEESSKEAEEEPSKEAEEETAPPAAAVPMPASSGEAPAAPSEPVDPSMSMAIVLHPDAPVEPTSPPEPPVAGPDLGEYEQIMTIRIRSVETKAEIAERILPRLKELGRVSDNVDASYLRLRHKPSSKATTILKSACRVSDSAHVYEGMQLAVEVLPEPEEVVRDDLVLVLLWWDQARWKIGPCKEYLVKMTASMADIAGQLASAYGIDVAELSFCNPMRPPTAGELPDQRWLRCSTHQTAMSQMYMKDGNIVILTDFAVTRKELSHEEAVAMKRAPIALPASAGSTPSTFKYTPTSTYRRPERALKILTKQEREAAKKAVEEGRAAGLDVPDAEDPASSAGVGSVAANAGEELDDESLARVLAATSGPGSSAPRTVAPTSYSDMSRETAMTRQRMAIEARERSEMEEEMEEQDAVPGGALFDDFW